MGFRFNMTASSAPGVGHVCWEKQLLVVWIANTQVCCNYTCLLEHDMTMSCRWTIHCTFPSAKKKVLTLENYLKKKTDERRAFGMKNKKYKGYVLSLFFMFVFICSFPCSSLSVTPFLFYRCTALWDGMARCSHRDAFRLKWLLMLPVPLSWTWYSQNNLLSTHLSWFPKTIVTMICSCRACSLPTMSLGQQLPSCCTNTRKLLAYTTGVLN